jgi:hypothetical protein
MPVYEPQLIHRDFYPGNIVWRHARCSGMVDSANARHVPSRGTKPSVDQTFGRAFDTEIAYRTDTVCPDVGELSWGWSVVDPLTGVSGNTRMSGGARGDRVKAMEIKYAINEVVTRYCRGVDRADWELVRSCYHADAIDSHTGAFHGTRDEFVEFAKVATADSVVMNHCVLNHLISIEGPDVAASETYALTFYAIRNHDGTVLDNMHLVRYLDRFACRDSAWLIAERVVVTDWERTRSVVPPPERPGTIHGVRGPADPSFGFLPHGVAPSFQPAVP